MSAELGKYIELGCICVWFVSSYLATVLYFWKDCDKIHTTLEQFHELAKRANSLEELTDVENRLKEFYNKKVWNRGLGTHAKRIFGYIEGKRDAFAPLL
jgi:hypothetical protein